MGDMEAAVWTGEGLSSFFFDGSRVLPTTATLRNCSCGIIRPHAVKSGDAGKIIDAVMNSTTFTVTAMQMFELSAATAREFLEVYDGVIPKFSDAVDQLSIGPCIALEVVSRGQE